MTQISSILPYRRDVLSPDGCDMDFVQKHAKMIVDMKNIIKENSDNVYKL